MKSRSLLIINLGTPASPCESDVARYLREFLMDKFVIRIPLLIRFILVYLIIVPRRKKYSALNYQKIWTEEGSPLLLGTLALARRMEQFNTEFQQIKVAMRYGNPSIGHVLTHLKDSDQIDVLLLYPHETGSSTGTAIQKVLLEAKKLNIESRINFLPSFYDQNFFIKTLSRKIKTQLSDKNIDHFVFSYHGVPESHLGEKLNSKLNYQQQCFHTSNLIAKELDIQHKDFSTSFQSRLGKAQWIKPYLSSSLDELSEQGKKSVALISPSFIVDCLETLEELQIGVKNDFEQANPQAQIHVLPALNDSEEFAKNLLNWCLNTSGNSL